MGAKTSTTRPFRKGESIRIADTTLGGVIIRKVRGLDQYDVWVTSDRFVGRPSQNVRGPESDIRRLPGAHLWRIR